MRTHAIIPSLTAFTAILLIAANGVDTAPAITAASPVSTIAARVDESTGNYSVTWKRTAWTLRGSVPGPLREVALSPGADALGRYQEISFAWQEGDLPLRGRIRVYEEQPLVLFSDTCETATKLPPVPFPNFTNVPANLHIFSHSLKEFAVPQFAANEISTPWLLFDDNANAFMISPVTNFFVASMRGDGKQKIASGFNDQLRNLPAGFTHGTVLAFGAGINRTWDLWGKAMLTWQNARRPPYDADVVLKYLGYWTDNGATYYYNYDPEKGYAGTLQALVQRYREEQIPIRYLQLDSWWYSKSTTGAHGKPGKAKKVEKLPEGAWNRYGGTLEYQAHKDLFPDGLAAFQKSIGLPLVTHGRWIDPASSYHERYKISGVAAVDPKWWDDTADYLKSSGVITYEQDWCDRIFTYSPEFSSRVGVGEAFLDNMARACKERGMTLQYCMAYACYYMQGARYDNLTTVRTCTDRFNPNRWNDFLYVSRLASALGQWPWSDVYNSTETDNVLLSTLSAGAVGIGDALGHETKTNLLRSVREDGVIVKPDAPIVPLDRCYLTDTQHRDAPLTSSTYTEHAGLRTAYVFSFVRPKSAPGEIRFAPAELGFSEPVYVHDCFRGAARRLEANQTFAAPLAQGGTAFYVVSSVGKSGIAFLGDKDKFVSTGKQRIATAHDEIGKLTATLLFAEREKAVTLHGYSAVVPTVTVENGMAGPVNYESAGQYFAVEVRVDPESPTDSTSGDPVRQLTVVLSTQDKLAADSKR